MQLSHGGSTQSNIERANWDTSPRCPSLHQLFGEIRGLQIETFQSYKRLDMLQLLGNVCRHGEGASAEKLRAKYPELWTKTVDESEQFWIPVRSFMPVDSMQINVDLLRDLVNAVVLFWLDMRIACTEALVTNYPPMMKEVAKLQALRSALL